MRNVESDFIIFVELSCECNFILLFFRVECNFFFLDKVYGILKCWHKDMIVCLFFYYSFYEIDWGRCLFPILKGAEVNGTN